ncbi:hypothetical protein GZ77_25725 [Endozoicomonas montiporae]|uniref:F5/8 type C domain-containing protein n=2 Tax=Endozoicomonas montiporae TaxID=1027273 RepID=A0A081MZ71_9GAMM|nr:discoidin domain-containing protein [Endozoicomonas montiporae]AMO54966.1 hypothetical protein EZMO1_0737 [Endozoicomonas montiporae CL-33]KEQ11494.1 hypothetical protein GZ77_25725 [Endozoicomonas montiporae]
MRINKTIPLTMALLGASTAFASIDIHLSPTGNDIKGDASSSAPWKSLHKARDHIRSLAPLTDNVNVILAGGTYELSSTLELNEIDSGRNGYSITYKSAPGETAIISGGTVISGWSDPDGNGIWEAPVPEGIVSRQLYVDGQRATRARSVDGSGWYRNATGYSTPADVSSWKNPSDIELVFGYRWKMYRGGVSSVSGNQATLNEPFFTASAMGPFGLVDQNARVAWVENNLALLDTEGEWYLDSSAAGSSGNIATSGTATQSSTWSHGIASHAINGNTSGIWEHNQVTHTDLESQPYWTLDLGDVNPIESIKIWNRTDCCSDRLKNFHVFVSDDPFTGSSISDSQTQPGVTEKVFEGEAGVSEEFDINRAGRYVRIQLPDTAINGDNVLSLAEVEVFTGASSPSNVLYYKPRPGETLTGSNAVEVTIPRLEYLIEGNGVSHVNFEGLQFSYATWLYPNGENGYLSVQSGVHMKDTDYITIEDAFEGIEQIPGNVRFNFSDNITFRNNTFKHLGATALELGRGAQNNTVFNNIFEDISGSAVWVGHAQDSHVPDDSYKTKDNLIDNNLIQNTGREYDDTSGISSVWASRTVVINNDVINMPYSAISVGWGWGRYDVDQFAFIDDNTGKGYNSATQQRDTLVINNLIDKPMQVRHDGGGVYNLSSNINSRITGNVITGAYDLNGAVYLDDGSRGFQVNDNVSYNNTGPRLNEHIKGAQFHTLHNNDWSGGNANYDPAFESVVENAGRLSSPKERTISSIVKGLPPALPLPEGSIPPEFGLVVGKEATASDNSNTARHAIDGQSGSYWTPGSGANRAWWQIDFGDSKQISQVNLAFASIDSDQSIEYHKQGITFELLTSNDGNNWTTQSFYTPRGYGESYIPKTTINTNKQAINHLYLSDSPLARYLRINIVDTDGQDFGIARVKIQATPENHALDGTATQSSTWNGNDASRAINGNTGGSYGLGEITHTDMESQPYWTLDLGSIKDIGVVKIWNRTDCCSNRLSDFHVFISDEPFSGTTVEDSQSQDGVLDTYISGAVGRNTEVAINRTGRYVRIQLSNTSADEESVLSLAEVQVFGS